MPYRIENGRARCLLCTDEVIDNRSAAKVTHDAQHVAHNARMRPIPHQEGTPA